MLRPMLWKEFRDQLPILLGLIVLGGAAVVATATFMDVSDRYDPLQFRGYLEPARLAVVIFAAVGGYVVGGMLFANEHENGTNEFLMQLPQSRWRIWRSKIVAGLLLSALIGLAFLAIGYFAGVFTGPSLSAWVIWLGIIVLSCFAAGCCGSVLVPNVLGACAIGMLLHQFAYGAAFLVTKIVMRLFSESEFGTRVDEQENAFSVIAGILIGFVVLMLGSLLAFTRPDRQRRRQLIGPGAVGTAVRTVRSSSFPSLFGIRTLIWLMWRQWRLITFFLGFMALVIGGILLIPDVPRLLVWPVLTVTFGAIVGSLCFFDEQIRGSERFWAERALPADRLWLAKAVVGFGLTVGLCILMILPSVVMSFIEGREAGYQLGIARIFRSGFFNYLQFPFIKAILIWPIYGYAAGLIAGMSFRKPIVAVAVAVLTGGATAALWMPSLLTGGLMHWQVWLPVLTALLFSRFLVRPWATNRIGSKSNLVRMGFGLSAVYFLMAGGILWRVIEVPLIPEVEDDLRFAKSIPTNDETQPGRDLRRAIATYIKQAEPHQRTAAERPFGSVFSRESFARRGFYARQSVKDQIAEIPQFGYPENRPDIDAYLDAVAGGAEWLDHLDKVRGREPGVLNDVNQMFIFSSVDDLMKVRELIPAALARGLQEQARGRPDLFLDRFEASLTATRSVKNKSFYISILVGVATQQIATSSVGPWLSQLDNDPKLLRRCLAILKEQEKYCVSPQSDMILAEQVLVRNMFRDPHQWYSSEQVWGRSGAAKDDSSREADLLQFAWNVPWEKERLRRAIGLGNVEVPPAGLWERLWSIRGKPDPRYGENYLVGIPNAYFQEDHFKGSRSRLWDQFRWAEMEQRQLAANRAAMLQVALRLFVAERGKPPESLDELVPDYLPAVPVDPYDPAKKPFQYRVSPGEWIYIDERPSSTDPPGWDEGTKIPSLAFAAVAAAGGGATNWPRVVAFDYPPGFSPEFTIDDTDDLVMIAGLGGFVLWPQGLFELGAGGPGDIPGGVPLGFSAPEADPIIVAATGGALAFELWGILDIESAPYEERDPIETQKERFIPRWLKPGEMIVWSVGRDGLDDLGTMQLLNNGSFNRGDLLSIVPPPKPQSPPVSGGTK